MCGGGATHVSSKWQPGAQRTFGLHVSREYFSSQYRENTRVKIMAVLQQVDILTLMTVGLHCAHKLFNKSQRNKI